MWDLPVLTWQSDLVFQAPAHGLGCVVLLGRFEQASLVPDNERPLEVLCQAWRCFDQARLARCLWRSW